MIDLRSDTVTQPSARMRQAMFEAPVGDDVYGEDPTVNELEALAASMLDMEAALFVPSGTQSNLIALLTHCQRGDEYIVGADAHTYKFEGGGAAVLGGIQPQPVPFDAVGRLPLDAVEAVIKPDDPHYARTRLLALENTQHGRTLPLDYLAEARALVDRHNLALHLDGARVFNAAVRLGVPVSRIAMHFNSVSVCLSKGLGAPVGSVLCGSAEFVRAARRWRKVVGGGMRQAGVIAAAGIVALNEMVERLADDHANARTLAELLDGIDGVEVRHEWTQTNMVWARFPSSVVPALTHHAREHGLLLAPKPSGECRLVTHADVSTADVTAAAAILQRFMSTGGT